MGTEAITQRRTSVKARRREWVQIAQPQQGGGFREVREGDTMLKLRAMQQIRVLIQIVSLLLWGFRKTCRLP